MFIFFTHFARLLNERRILATTALLILTGELIGEPVAGQGPLMMNTREEIMQAMKDDQQGRMGRWGKGNSSG